MNRGRINHQGTLLIVEKDIHTAYLLDYLLSREGYNVVSTTDCEIATHLLSRMTGTNAIFLDVEFVRDEQCRFLDTLREMPGWRTTPVLLLAEHYTMDDVNLGLQAGADDYIIQPFDHAELISQIQRYAPKLTQT